MTDDIVQADARHERRMERCSRAMLAALRGRSAAPRELIWPEIARPSQWAPTGATSRDTRIAKAVASLARKEAMAARPRMDRDACPLCGVRADIGCRHRRVP